MVVSPPGSQAKPTTFCQNFSLTESHSPSCSTSYPKDALFDCLNGLFQLDDEPKSLLGKYLEITVSIRLKTYINSNILVKLCYIRMFTGFLPTLGNRGEQHEIEQIFSSLDINNNEEVWINTLQNAVLFGKR